MRAFTCAYEQYQPTHNRAAERDRICSCGYIAHPNEDGLDVSDTCMKQDSGARQIGRESHGCQCTVLRSCRYFDWC